MATSGLVRSVRAVSAVIMNASPIHMSSGAFTSTKTHTGQVFEANDYRNARFEVTPRQTNEHWAINLIKEVPPKGVQARVVACDGGPGALGHPRVYINLDEPGNHSCIYCGLQFFKEGGH